MAETQSAPSIPSEWGQAVAAKVARAIRDACGSAADQHGHATEEIDDACDAAVKATMQSLAEAFVISGDVLATPPTTHVEAIASARAEGVREGLEKAAGMEGRFWLELREPRRVPERKGSWPRADMAKVLREFMAARPQAYITVVTVDHDGPLLRDGPETLQMADARSMTTGSRHIESVRAAHGSHEYLSDTETPDRRALKLAMQFVDRCAGVEFGFDAEDDKPAANSTDVCFAVADALGIEDLGGPEYEALVAYPAPTTLSSGGSHE